MDLAFGVVEPVTAEHFSLIFGNVSGGASALGQFGSALANRQLIVALFIAFVPPQGGVLVDWLLGGLVGGWHFGLD